MLCMQSLNSENYGRTTVGEMPQNRALNRFKHIVPCEISINFFSPRRYYRVCVVIQMMITE